MLHLLPINTHRLPHAPTDVHMEHFPATLFTHLQKLVLPYYLRRSTREPLPPMASTEHVPHTQQHMHSPSEPSEALKVGVCVAHALLAPLAAHLQADAPYCAHVRAAHPHGAWIIRRESHGSGRPGRPRRPLTWPVKEGHAPLSSLCHAWAACRLDMEVHQTTFERWPDK